MNPTPPVEKTRFQRFLLHLRSLLFKGIIVVFPAAAVLFIGALILNFTLRILRPISAYLATWFIEEQWLMDLISFGILIAILLFIGFLVRHRIAYSELLRIETRILSRVPFYAMVRETVSQFTGLKKMPFSEAVLVDPFGTGCLMTGFLVGTSSDEHFTVFVPTAPNPTNGYVFHMPRSKIVFTRVRPTEAMRTVVGMGTGSEIMFDPTLRSRQGEEEGE